MAMSPHEERLAMAMKLKASSPEFLPSSHTNTNSYTNERLEMAMKLKSSSPEFLPPSHTNTPSSPEFLPPSHTNTPSSTNTSSSPEFRPPSHTNTTSSTNTNSYTSERFTTPPSHTNTTSSTNTNSYTTPPSHTNTTSSTNTNSYTNERFTAPLKDSHHRHIRPMLDVIDRLRNLGIMQQGIELPSIVVVGDQSSGKSSVLSCLAGVKIPRGREICTRVPLELRLQSCADDSLHSITIKYEGAGPVEIQENDITDAISRATEAVAGQGTGISHSPITLHVVRTGAPDLTLIDLPGITRVPLPDQPADIYEQIKEIIIRYITPAETIILNVISAEVDFPTCESIRMSKEVDPNGDRTVAVVTKCDRGAEGLYEKVTANTVKVGQGFVCVYSGKLEDSAEEARRKEKAMFESVPLLRKLDRSMVGVPVLARRLMEIQAGKIRSTMPLIARNIESKLSEQQRELRSLPQHLCNAQEADVAFVKMVNAMKECLQKILLDGDIQRFRSDRRMHCTARLKEMYYVFYEEIRGATRVDEENFLERESELLDEAKGVGLPNFLPRPVLLSLVNQLVEDVTDASLGLVDKVWDYLEFVLGRVVDEYCSALPVLHGRVQSVVHELVEKKRSEYEEKVNVMLETETDLDFTMSPVYSDTYGKLSASKDEFLEQIRKDKSGHIDVEGSGKLSLSHVNELGRERLEAAYEMWMSVTSYWKVVTLRIGDGIPLMLKFGCRNVVKGEFEEELLRKIMKVGDLEKVMAESPKVAAKRTELRKIIDLLKESKSAVSGILLDC